MLIDYQNNESTWNKMKSHSHRKKIKNGLK